MHEYVDPSFKAVPESVGFWWQEFTRPRHMCAAIVEGDVRLQADYASRLTSPTLDFFDHRKYRTIPVEGRYVLSPWQVRGSNSLVAYRSVHHDTRIRARQGLILTLDSEGKKRIARNAVISAEGVQQIGRDFTVRSLYHLAALFLPRSDADVERLLCEQIDQMARAQAEAFDAGDRLVLEYFAVPPSEVLEELVDVKNGG